MPNLLIYKHPAIVQSSHSLDITEKRLILHCLGRIDQRQNIDPLVLYAIDIREYASYWSLDPANAYRELRDACLSLLDRTLQFPTKLIDPDASDSSRTVMNWVSDITYDNATCTIAIRWTVGAAPLLGNLKGYFLKYNLEYISKMKSVYSIRLYELCKQYQKIGKRTFKIEEIREILETGDSYPLFANFKARVIESAVKDICKFTDIDVTTTYDARQSRSITHVVFNIKGKCNETK